MPGAPAARGAGSISFGMPAPLSIYADSAVVDIRPALNGHKTPSLLPADLCDESAAKLTARMSADRRPRAYVGR